MNVDECAEHLDTCHPDAICTDTVGSFNCSCKEGFAGDGYDCTGKQTYYSHFIIGCSITYITLVSLFVTLQTSMSAVLESMPATQMLNAQIHLGTTHVNATPVLNLTADVFIFHNVYFYSSFYSDCNVTM